MSENKNVFYKIEKSALVSVIGIIFLFSFSVAVVLIAPQNVDKSWTTPSSNYQVQMYEVEDPNIYVGTYSKGGQELQFIHHLKQDFTLLGFQESDLTRIIAPPDLEKYVTRHDDKILKLTSRLLLLRKPEAQQAKEGFNAVETAEKLKKDLKEKWVKAHPKAKENKEIMPVVEVIELYDPGVQEAFSVASPDVILSDWVDENYKILDSNVKQLYHNATGVVFVKNPMEYRLTHYTFAGESLWHYDPKGKPMKDIQDLKTHPLEFRSRKELISLGEHIYKIEGCWYCHTDQTRTLVQDVVLNGSAEYPAPPSSANEYIYQYTTFPGTRRIGPDMSRVGVKRPSRDWHKGHFWSPKTASKGSIMPSFKHFFDFDPRGTDISTVGIPNYKFEAVFQYLMTKGTRITPPTEAWWLGKDPVKTKEIIEGRHKLP